MPKLSLPTVSIPTELQSTLKRVLDGTLTLLGVAPTARIVSLMRIGHPRKKLVADGRVLYKYLISRKTVSRVQESRRRRVLLRMVPGIYPLETHYLPVGGAANSLTLSFSLSLSLYVCSVVKLWREKQKNSSIKETAESVLR